MFGIRRFIEHGRSNYAGSMVLGLNDALVELTGALAGLTFALQNTQIVAVTGLVTGIAASLSMAASEYLSSREEKVEGKNPLRAALYTGLAYIVAVILLVMPYFLLSNIYHALVATLLVAVCIVLFYTYYVSTVEHVPFWQRFLLMISISFGVALISFGVGFIVRAVFGIEV